MKTIQKMLTGNKRILVLPFFLVFLGFSACRQDYTPKPKGFFRIALPEKEYKLFDSLPFPYRFEYPSYASVKPIYEKGEEYWVDLVFHSLNAKLHLSYKNLHKDMDKYTESSLFYVNKHIPKATGIFEKEFSIKDRKLFAFIYEIKGNEVASTYQFYATDSSQHFIRGALYIETSPNNDSLKPIIDFLKKDVDHLIETLYWK